MSTSQPPGDHEYRGGSSRGIVLVVMCVGYFLVLLDVTIVNTALPRIGSELATGLSGLQWVVDGYTVALAAPMLAGGTVGDLHGHKRLVLAGLGVLAAGSLGCGLAPDIELLNVFRVVQGVGSAVMLPATLAVVTHAYPEPREQARAIGIWAGIGSSALVVGPLLGGVLTDLVHWRAVFLFNVPVALAVIPVVVRAVRESRNPRGHRVDVAGVVLGAAVLAAVTVAFIEGGHGGVDVLTIVATAAAVVLGAVFVMVERHRSSPMLPLSLFADARFSAANVVAGGMNLGTVGLLFVFNLYLQDVLGYSAVLAGLALVPLYVPLCALAPVGGRLAAHLGPRWPMVGGLITAAVGIALLALLGDRSSVPSMLPALVVWGTGLGILTPAVVTAAIDAVPADRAGLASAVNNTSRQAFQAIGIAAFGALAGAPGTAAFLGGFHLTAITTTGIYLLGAVLVLVSFGRRRDGGRPGHHGHAEPAGTGQGRS